MPGDKELMVVAGVSSEASVLQEAGEAEPGAGEDALLPLPSPAALGSLNGMCLREQFSTASRLASQLG